jgi:hypothetical protein
MRKIQTTQNGKTELMKGESEEEKMKANQAATRESALELFRRSEG